MDKLDEFEAHRTHLRAVAYRMLGSANEADDALQEAWLRVARADADGVRSVRAWLTTVVARVCLDLLRARGARREVPLEATTVAQSPDPEQEAALAESVGLALLVVLDTLTPAERLAFVLHDMFAVPFDEIAAIVGRSVAATKMLASRARQRVRVAGSPDADPVRQRRIVDAFLAAAREGDFAALIALLDPDVVVCADAAVAPRGAPTRVRGARGVARQALAFAKLAGHADVVLLNGAPAIVVAPRGRPEIVMTFIFSASGIIGIDIARPRTSGAEAQSRPDVVDRDLTDGLSPALGHEPGEDVPVEVRTELARLGVGDPGKAVVTRGLDRGSGEGIDRRRVPHEGDDGISLGCVLPDGHTVGELEVDAVGRSEHDDMGSRLDL